jgi:hypothetical protein
MCLQGKYRSPTNPRDPVAQRGPKEKPAADVKVHIPVRVSRARVAALRRAAKRHNLTLTDFVGRLVAIVDDGRPYDPQSDTASADEPVTRGSRD